MWDTTNAQIKRCEIQSQFVSNSLASESWSTGVEIEGVLVLYQVCEFWGTSSSFWNRFTDVDS
jgi:hypothetical protein